jgi:hypothetical protein
MYRAPAFAGRQVRLWSMNELVNGLKPVAIDMGRAYGTSCKWGAIFINGLKSVATICFEPTALVNEQ